MVTAKQSTLLFAVLALSACSEPKLSPYQILPGDWGWEDSDECASVPQSIRFSPDKKRMVIRQAPMGADGRREPALDVGYAIEGQSGNVLHTAMDKEERKDEAGRLVKWNLVVADQDTFCWRQTDWPPTACTKMIRRCKV